MNNYAYLGLVRRRTFELLATDSDAVGAYRLTNLPVTSEEKPESDELSLAEYEGSAILIRGFHRARWIHSAVIVERAGLILTATLQKVFATAEGSRPAVLGFPFS